MIKLGVTIPTRSFRFAYHSFLILVVVEGPSLNAVITAWIQQGDGDER